MRKYTFKREFSLIAPKHYEDGFTTRYWKAHNVQGIKYILENFKVFSGREFNLYTSLAKYKHGIPNQTMNLKRRDNDDWKKNHWREIEKYDFFLDVDAGDDLKEAIKQTKNLIRFLNDCNVPFYLRFSGNGFHILIPETEFPKQLSYDPYGEKTIYHKYRELCLFLKDNVCSMLDTSIYDSQRQIKLPYSIALYPHGEFVCTPLPSDDLDDFQIESVKPNVVFEQMPQERLFNPKGNVDMLLKLSRVKWD